MFARVSIITRTKNRPITLQRAIKSVCAQTYQDWLLVVVNDGGEPESVNTLIEEYRDLLIDRIKVIHNDTSVGMEAASNVGIKAVDSDFILIHDDDDTIEPAFLEKTIIFLDSNMGAHYEGAATGVMEITEAIISDKIVFESKKQYNPSTKSILLSEMAVSNKIPPISCLYRRRVHDAVGYYNEDLPVLGDWDFYLRLLRRFDIYKMEEILANYHIRAKSADIYGNTVTAGRQNHISLNAVIRNKMLRDDLDKGVFGLGFVVNAPYFSNNALGGKASIDEYVREARGHIIWQLGINNIKKISMYAAGEYGRKLAKALKESGIEVLFFVEGNEALWGTVIDGIEVISLDEAAARGCKIFVIGSKTYGSQIAKKIKDEFINRNMTYNIVTG